ncbi:MAG: ABC transporter substrate-binding protein [Deltaproteobacteria bacterium]|nr:ABC transporter substrate-binding protein [Deltaproteobacteria bacterium]MBW1922652.1 ABC transporter substrate-binding protein [Deltaproteobacteria bacterium]MBW1948723.1 ABC transporter substrate-binding protein [Deltaproteobacteria bacterium]MBW2008086.1 ABC transporter substrate-binding protein [Deltaproteobacteria bacterium]MBW2346864.1 ABC transporter substrate-binding protein [Deltaproteobacteria bacterium]
MRRPFTWAVVLLIALGISAAGPSTPAFAKDVKVGAIINLTGPASSWGQYHAKGQQDYTRYVNEVKGGVYGNKIALTVVDHGYKVPEAVKYVKKFCTEDKMDIIATWDAGSGIMAKPIFQKYKVPDINYSTYIGFLKPPIDYAYLPFGDYNMDSYAILEYIKNLHKGGVPKVGLLTYNNAYGKAIHGPCKEYAAKYNVNIVAIEQFPPKSLDLKTELLRLKNKGAQYVVMQVLPSAVLMALQSADRVNYDVPFFATWTSTDPDFFKRAKGLLRNRMAVQFCGGLPADRSPGVRLLQDLGRRYGTVIKFDFSYWEGVVIGMIMERAFQRAHEKFGEINSGTINQALQTFRNENFGGLVPDITYTNTDHSASWKARIVRLNEDQTYTPLTNFWGPGKEKVKILQ